MAVTEKPNGTVLKLSVTKTIDGKTKTATRSWSKVKPDATAQAVYNVADSLADLQVNPVAAILRVDNTELLETV